MQNQRVTCPEGRGRILREVTTNGTVLFGRVRVGGEQSYQIQLDTGKTVVYLKSECVRG